MKTGLISAQWWAQLLQDFYQLKACLLISPKHIRGANTSLKTCFFKLTLPDCFILFSLKGVFSFSCFPFPGI